MEWAIPHDDPDPTEGAEGKWISAWNESAIVGVVLKMVVPNRRAVSCLCSRDGIYRSGSGEFCA